MVRVLAVQPTAGLGRRPTLNQCCRSRRQWCCLKTPMPRRVAETERRRQPASVWTEAAHLSLLPSSWRSWTPITRRFWPGRRGATRSSRTATRSIHLTIAMRPGIRRRRRLAVWCRRILVREDGTLVHSDQLALVKAFVSGGSDVGYLVVVEIDDQPRSVRLWRTLLRTYWLPKRSVEAASTKTASCLRLRRDDDLPIACRDAMRVGASRGHQGQPTR